MIRKMAEVMHFVGRKQQINVQKSTLIQLYKIVQKAKYPNILDINERIR